MPSILISPEVLPPIWRFWAVILDISLFEMLKSCPETVPTPIFPPSEAVIAVSAVPEFRLP